MKKWNIPRTPQGDAHPFEVNGEEFKVYAPLPGLPLMELAVAVDQEDQDQADASGAAAWGRFLYAVLGAEQYTRFREVCLRDSVSPEALMEIGQWIIEEVSGRPLEEHSSSPESPSAGIPSSTLPPPLPEPTGLPTGPSTGS